MIEASQRRAFPPRLPQQPVFNPVTNEQYAILIARDWNSSDPNSEYVGLVTAFDLPEEFLERYPVPTVGGRVAQELWVLAELNAQIVGPIRLLHVYYGQEYRGPRGLGGFP